MLFLKYLDDLEETRSMEAELVGKSYERVIDEDYSWSAWAPPKNDDGSFDHDVALVGDDLIEYVNHDLFPYLQGLKERPAKGISDLRIGTLLAGGRFGIRLGKAAGSASTEISLRPRCCSKLGGSGMIIAVPKATLP